MCVPSLVEAHPSPATDGAGASGSTTEVVGLGVGSAGVGREGVGAPREGEPGGCQLPLTA